MKAIILCMMALGVCAGVSAQTCWKKSLPWNSNLQAPNVVQSASVADKYFVQLDNRLLCLNASGGVLWKLDFDFIAIKEIKVSADGKLLVCGDRLLSYQPVPQFPYMNTKATVLKIDTAGKVLWEYSINPPMGFASSAGTCTPVAGGGVVFSYGVSDAVQIMHGFQVLDGNGAFATSYNYPIIGYGKLTTLSNGYIYYNADSAIFLNSQFVRQQGLSQAQLGTGRINKIIPAANGGLLCGEGTTKFDASGGVEWSIPISSADGLMVADGYVLLSRVTDTTQHPFSFLRLIKLNNQGQQLWQAEMKKTGAHLVAGNISGGAAPNTYFVMDGKSYYALVTDSAGSCLTGVGDSLMPEKFTTLAINEVVANLSNDGIVLEASDIGPFGMLYPANNPKNTIYTSALWLGGIDASGGLHLSAQAYRQGERGFAPFPQGATETEQHAWDHMWRVTRQEVMLARQDFADNGQFDNAIPAAVLHWPAKLNANAKGAFGSPLNVLFDAAPFNDYNNDGIYNAYDGDYPIVYGDEMYWWMFTDSLPLPIATDETPALGVDVSAFAYAFNNPSDSVLHRTVFTRYEIVNKSSNTYQDLYVGIFSDIEIGCYTNDYLGCDTVLDFYYGYNGEPLDTCSNSYRNYAFGANPPVQSVVFLNVGLDRFIPEYYNFDVNLPKYTHQYRMLQALDDNQQYPYNPFTGTYGHHVFTGDPADPSDWSARSINAPLVGDNKGIGASGPHVLAPNDVFVLEVAYIVHPNGNLLENGGYANVQNEVAHIRGFNDGYVPLDNTAAPNPLANVHIYPNPSIGVFTLQSNVSINKVEVLDINGRGVNFLQQGSTIIIDTDGVFIVKLATEKGIVYQRVVVFQ